VNEGSEKWRVRRVASCSAGEGRQQSLTPVTLQSRIVINNVVSACVQSVQSVQIIVARQQAGRGGERESGVVCCVLWVGLVGLVVGLVVGCCVGWARNSRSPQAWCGALLAQA
jgi:hypothetical protein